MGVERANVAVQSVRVGDGLTKTAADCATAGVNHASGAASCVRRGVGLVHAAVDSAQSGVSSVSVREGTATMRDGSAPMRDDYAQTAVVGAGTTGHVASCARACASSTGRITGGGAGSAPPSATLGRMSAGAGDMPVARGNVAAMASQRVAGATQPAEPCVTPGAYSPLLGAEPAACGGPPDRVATGSDRHEADTSHGPTLSAGAGVVGTKDGGAGAQVEAHGGTRAAHSGRCGARRSRRGTRVAGCAIAAAARCSRLYAVTAQTSAWPVPLGLSPDERSLAGAECGILDEPAGARRHLPGAVVPREGRHPRPVGDDGEWRRMPGPSHGVLRDLYYRRGYGPPWAAGAWVHVQ